MFHHLCPPCPQISASHPDTQIKHGSSFSAVFCVGRVKRFLKWPYPVSPLGRGGKLSLPLSISNFLFLSVNTSPFPCLALFFRRCEEFQNEIKEKNEARDTLNSRHLGNCSIEGLRDPRATLLRLLSCPSPHWSGALISHSSFNTELASYLHS